MRWVGHGRNSYRILVGNIEQKRALENSRVYGRIILKCILNSVHVWGLELPSSG
jgi:hypothetical protein